MRCASSGGGDGAMSDGAGRGKASAMEDLRRERVVARLLLMFSPLEGDRAGHAR